MRSLAEWLEQQQRSHPSAIDLDLSRVREVARRLDLLTPDYRVITVGGTNGKGSTVACLDALLRAAGHRCGRFTSPHLARYNERICVDGDEASDAEPRSTAFERIDAARGGHHAHVLRVQRARGARSFPPFARRRGGARSRARRATRRHQHHRCGRRRGLLDRHRSRRLAGRHARGDRPREGRHFSRGRGRRCSAAPICRAVVWAAIEEVGARAVVPGRDYRFRERARAGGTWDFEYGACVAARSAAARARGHTPDGAMPATALAAHRRRWVASSSRTRTSARRCAACGFAGRFQRVPGEVEWILDVAHNVPAALGSGREPARAAARAHDRGVRNSRRQGHAGNHRGVERGHRCVGARDARGSARRADARARAAPAARTRAILAHAPDVAAGCRAARDAARPGDRILVFGSFLTVGPALEFLGHIVRPWIREPSND